MSSSGSLHFLVIQVIGRVISLWLRDFGARCLLDACRSHLQVVHFIMPARAPLDQLSNREPVYHEVIIRGASCYFCHIPLAGGNRPKFCSPSSLSQGLSAKRREPRTRGDSDSHKLLQHASSGHHHIQLSGGGGSSVKARSQYWFLPLAKCVHNQPSSPALLPPRCLLVPLFSSLWGCGCSPPPLLPPFSGFYHQPQLHCSNEDHNVSTCDEYNVSSYRGLKACVSRVLGAIRAFVLQLLHIYVCPVHWRHPFFSFGRLDHWIRVSSHSPSMFIVHRFLSSPPVSK